MPIYTFYPCAPDGGSTSFDAADMASDAEAKAHAARLLLEHASSAYVVVWLGERQVMTCERAPLPQAHQGASGAGCDAS
jgi:hypothetical protein